MRRRKFITLLGGAAAWPLAAGAQQADRMRRIGVLMAFDENDPKTKGWLSNFTQGLAELDWTDARTVRIDVRYVLPDYFFESQPTVGDVVKLILSALERNGYVERSFFGTEAGGVALVTRLERINEDGSSFREEERWPPGVRAPSGPDLIRFLRGLFFVDPGHYRVIVFILLDVPFTQSGEEITQEDTLAWLRSGANILPPEIARRAFSGSHCTVLIYEFASDGTTVRRVDSRLTGKQHLEKAGVLSLFEK